MNRSRLGVILMAVTPITAGCGHSRYDDFVNNSVSDDLGRLMLVMMALSAVLFLILNRRPDPANCRHAASPDVCYHARCRNGVGNLAEVGSACAFIFTMGAGMAWLNDPAGWLAMSTPLTGAIGR